MSFWKLIIMATSISFISIVVFGGTAEKISSLGLTDMQCKVLSQPMKNVNGAWSSNGDQRVSEKLVIAGNQREAVQILLNKLTSFKIKTDKDYFLGLDDAGGISAVLDITCN